MINLENVLFALLIVEILRFFGEFFNIIRENIIVTRNYKIYLESADHEKKRADYWQNEFRKIMSAHNTLLSEKDKKEG